MLASAEWDEVSLTAENGAVDSAKIRCGNRSSSKVKGRCASREVTSADG